MSPFWKGGAGKRRDGNEKAIVEALEAAGARVWRVGGRGLPDLIAWRGGRPYLFEVKTAKGKQKPSQVGTPWPIVRSVSDALKEIQR